jgi:hypothetical protein
MESIDFLIQKYLILFLIIGIEFYLCDTNSLDFGFTLTNWTGIQSASLKIRNG